MVWLISSRMLSGCSARGSQPEAESWHDASTCAENLANSIGQRPGSLHLNHRTRRAFSGCRQTHISPK